MALGIKAMQTIRSLYGEQTEFLPLQLTFFWHLQYPSLLLTRNTTNIIDKLDQKIN